MSYRHGHCKENRKVTRKAQAWFDTIQAELLARIEAAIAAQEARKAEATTPVQPAQAA